MKKNDDLDPKKFINDTLAKSKTLTRSANQFLQQNNLSNNINPKFPNDTEEQKKKKLYSNKEEREAIKEELNLEDENEEQNTDDEDNNGIFTMEYITRNIERYQKFVTRFDEQVRKNLLLSKQHPDDICINKDLAYEIADTNSFIKPFIQMQVNKRFGENTFRDIIRSYIADMDLEYVKTKDEINL